MIKKNILFALPLIFNNLIGAVGGFISMLIIAGLGHDVVAAGALIYSTYGIIITICFALMVPVSIFIAQAFGSKNYDNMGCLLRGGAVLGLIVVIIVTTILWFLPQILLFFKQPPHIVAITAVYFKALIPWVFPFVMRTLLTQFANGVAKPKINLYFSLLTLPIAPILGYIMVYGKLGVPAMGIVGYAYAFSISNWFGLLVTILYFSRSKYFRMFNMFHSKTLLGIQQLRKIINLGLPIVVQRVGEVAAFSVITFLMGTIGVEELAAQQVAIQYRVLALMATFGFSQAASILVGHEMGAQQPLHAKKHAWISVCAANIITLLCSLLFVFAPLLLISGFLDIHNVALASTIALAALLLKISAVTQLFDSARNVATGALRGFHDTKYPMYVGILCFWIIGIPAGYLTGITFHLGAAGLVGGFTLGIIVGCVFILRRLWKKDVNAAMINQPR